MRGETVSGWQRVWLGGLKFGLDLILGAMAVVLALVLRLDMRAFQAPYWRMGGLYLGASLLVKASIEVGFRLYRLAWRRASTWDLLRLTQTMAGVTLLNSTLAFLGRDWVSVPRSIPFLDGVLSLLLLGGARFAVRLWDEHRHRSSSGLKPKKVLIVGAGEAGALVAREMRRHPEHGLIPVAFLDDDPYKQGVFIEGVEVVGRTKELVRIAASRGVQEVLIAMPSAPGKVIRRVVVLCREAGLPYRTIPAFYELLNGSVRLSQIREVRLEDLLRREPVSLDLASIAGYLKGKVVLITGAGGSIGSEIVRQVGRFQPELVVLLGRGENRLFELEQQLKWEEARFSWEIVVGDVRDREKLAWLFAKFQPQVVFHAAAHKHVPYMEFFPDEAILNNVGGTKNLVEMALVYGVERLVNISTDKAVNPTSVMGASKRIAEYLVQWAASQVYEGQAFVSVRFGNVLGSKGSVVPLFQEQIRRGGPITVTHPEMRRYFMTIPEAAQLVLQAGGLGENGAVYVLDMGEPVRIVELAETLVTLSGLEPYEDIEITFTGIRPGEKLFEELLTAEEGVAASRHEKIFIARGTCPPPETLLEGVNDLLAAARERDFTRVRQILRRLIPSYRQPT